MTISNDQQAKAMKWEFHDFRSLDTAALFALMKLRVDVFVVEQDCAYRELDDIDTAPHTIHLLGLADGELVAYARAIAGNTHSSEHGLANPKAQSMQPIRIGRVVVARAFRGRGLATTLMQQLMSHLQVRFPDRHHCLAAQTRVQAFYATLGFVPVSDVYLEDGIAHVDMVRQVACHEAPSANPDT